MIRINLLGLPRPKKGKRNSAAAAMEVGGSSNGPSAAMLMAAGLALGFIVSGFFWYKANNESKAIAIKMDEAQREGRRLAEIKVKFDRRSEEARMFERRVKVIDQLRADQSGPVKLLNAIGDTVNSTDAVWLNTMNETGNTVNIEGMALSTHAVANLITNLKSSGYFKSVEVKDATQDTVSKEITQFSFHLACEKAPQQAAQPKS